MRQYLVLPAAMMMSILLQPVYAISPPATMTYIEWRPLVKGAKKDDFSVSTRKAWRAGTQYYRVDEAPDPVEGIHGTMIVKEPDIWLWNKYSNIARHLIDPSPTFDVHAPVFSWAEKKLTDLEFGEEDAFFTRRHAKKLPDSTIKGIKVTVQSVTLEDGTLTLFSRKADNTPFQLELQRSNTTQTVRYDRYSNNLPFDATLFILPDSVKVMDMLTDTTPPTTTP